MYYQSAETKEFSHGGHREIVVAILVPPRASGGRVGSSEVEEEARLYTSKVRCPEEGKEDTVRRNRCTWIILSADDDDHDDEVR